MPGILPMKVIKMGPSDQSRVAQACDRCRSKKIRCDGIRPSCTQCANVGFECKTSDRLSRRAFPRGYTESLEERIRVLEAEVRELKDLLDEKDEKIEMLSKLHSLSPPRTSASQKVAHPTSSAPTSLQPEESGSNRDVVSGSPESASRQSSKRPRSRHKGVPPGRALIEAFKRKTKESATRSIDFDADAILNPVRMKPTLPRSNPQRSVPYGGPPRLVSDHLMNVYLQEWAPIFPVLHKPTLLSAYERYVTNPETLDDKRALTQLYLVFGIAALSCSSKMQEDIAMFELQWEAALESFLIEHSLFTLQCLILAQIYCIQKGDSSRLIKYKGLSTPISYKLNLHQHTNRFAFDSLTSKMRRRVFWALYTVDCFSAASLGLPKDIKEDEVECEYPSDIDDEIKTEDEFMTNVAGKLAKTYGALAFFQLARVMSKMMDQGALSSSPSETSVPKVNSALAELDDWFDKLAPSLKLRFVQDKPSTDLVNSRSLMTSLAYYYTRMLLYASAVCANSGRKSASFVVALADSCKHVILIVQLLQERSMSFSISLSLRETLVMSIFGLLFQALQLDRSGRLIKDHERLVSNAIRILERSEEPNVAELRRISRFILSSEQNVEHNEAPSQEGDVLDRKHMWSRPRDESRASSGYDVRPGYGDRYNPRRQLDSRRAAESQLSSSSVSQHPSSSSISQVPSSSSVSLSSARSEPAGFQPPPPNTGGNINQVRRRSTLAGPLNLDFLSFGGEMASYAPAPTESPVSMSHIEVAGAELERLFGNISDDQKDSSYMSSYVRPSAKAVPDLQGPPSGSQASFAWSADTPGIGSQISNIGGEIGPSQGPLSASSDAPAAGHQFGPYGLPDPVTRRRSEPYPATLVSEYDNAATTMAPMDLGGFQKSYPF